jgi:adenylyl-sulfate kinase
MTNQGSGRVVWLTGLPASGKTTIANELNRHLLSLGQQVYVLDGDQLRHGLCSNLGFSRADRRENTRRVCEVAKLFADAGIICIVALISPYRSDRELVRDKISRPQFMEVYVNAPVEVCEQRDPKGLYRRARASQIKDFTGVSAPYEPPLQPAIELRTDKMSVTEAVQKVLTHLSKSIQVPDRR